MGISRAMIVGVVLLASAGLTQWLAQSEEIPPNRSFSSFPMQIDTWQGRRSSLDAEIFNVLGVEDYVLADYHKPQRERVNLYVGFYQSQKKGDIIHSPKNCLPGAGWKIVESTIEEVVFPDEKAPTKVARLLLEKAGANQVVLYWFQSRGRIIASEYMQKIWLVVDSITKKRTDGSFVRLISPVTDSPQKTFDRLKEFAVQVKPHLDAHIPL